MQDDELNQPETEILVPQAAETPAEDSGTQGGSNEPSETAIAISAMGLTRMSLQELKDKSPSDLLSFAEQLEIDSANSMRKQDMMFAILKVLAEEGVEILRIWHSGRGPGRVRFPAQSRGQLPARS